MANKPSARSSGALLKYCAAGLFLIFAGLLAQSGLAQSPLNFESAMARYNQGEFNSARTALEALAQAGDPRAQYTLGVMMLEGKGGAKDLSGALGWFHKAVEQGNVSAAKGLAGMYDEGIGMAEDNVEAARWYRIAADKGDADAQYNLGLLYLAGEGVAKDAATAVSWWRKSADQGEANAQYNMGIAYAKGVGVASDRAQNLYWMRRAAAQGYQQAVEAAARLSAEATAAELAEVAKLETARGPIPKSETARVDAARLATSSAAAARAGSVRLDAAKDGSQATTAASGSSPAASRLSQTALSPTDSAIASYLNTTLPAIERMKPFIGQPEAARAAAFAGMGLPEAACNAAARDAIYAREKLAEGAAEICSGLIAWMQADEISACSEVKHSKSDLATTDQANPAILNRHIETDVPGTRLQLQQAAGCAQKDITYWGGAVIQIYDELSRSVSLTGDMVVSAPGNAPLTTKQFDHKLFQCHLARNLDDTRKSAVVEAANDGCYVMYDLAARNVQGACESIETGLKTIDAIGAGDPFAREAPAVRTLLIDSFSDLTCGPILTAAHAEARAAAAKLKQAEEAKAAQAAYDAAWATYNDLQIKIADIYEELSLWGDGYVPATADDIEYASVEDGYCQIYFRLSSTQGHIMDTARKIHRMLPNGDNATMVKSEEILKDELNIARVEWCQLGKE